MTAHTRTASLPGLPDHCGECTAAAKAIIDWPCQGRDVERADELGYLAAFKSRRGDDGRDAERNQVHLAWCLGYKRGIAEKEAS